MKIRFNKKIIAVIGLFILGIGIGIGGMVLKERFFPSDETKIAEAQKNEVKIGPLIEMEEFLINLDSGGIIKTVITVEGVDGKSQEKIKAKEIFIRDRIITVLGSKRIGDLKTEGREKLKKELTEELNEVCNNEIKDVLFKSFVYQ